MNIRVTNGIELEEALKNNTNPNEDLNISAAPGTYEICHTLNITRSNVSIIGENGDVKLRGSKTVYIDNLPRTDNIVSVNLRECGINDAGKFGLGPFEDFWIVYDIPKPHMTDSGPGLELFYAEKIMPISRYPKKGFMHIKKSLGDTPINFRDKQNGTQEGKFIPDDNIVKTWDDYRNILLIGYWNADWATQRHAIESIDKNTGEINVTKPYHCFGYRDGECFTEKNGGKFYAINVRSAVQNPGEWCIDRENMILYIYPYENQKYINISCADDMFYACGVNNIKISGFDISECRKSGIMLENCSNILISDVNVKNVGAWGILAESCRHTTIQRCEVSLTGGGGIGANGGDRKKLISSENIVRKCTVHDISRWHKTYMAALDISGVGCTLSENYIYDVPHFGIVFAGNNHIIEKNEIKNACYESNDAGAIYSGKNYTYYGNIIRYNYIHDLPGYNNCGCVGLYFDDAMSSADVYGNVFANIPYIGLLVGGGRDFQIHDNMFINCKMSIMYDQRAAEWKSLYQRLLDRLDEVDITSDAWKNAYPSLYKIHSNDMFMPIGNSITGNTIIGGDGFAFQKESLINITTIKNNKFSMSSFPEPHDKYHDKGWFYINTTQKTGKAGGKEV